MKTTKGSEHSEAPDHKTELAKKLEEIEASERELEALLAEGKQREAARAQEDTEHAATPTTATHDGIDLTDLVEDGPAGNNGDSDTAGAVDHADNEDVDKAAWTPSADIHNTEFVPAGVSKESHALIHAELKAGRRHFGSPAATINDSDFDDTKEIAGKAERLTSQHILDWISSRQINNAVLVDSVSIPGLSEKDTDHLLILGNTVLAVDTKAFATGYNYKFKNKKYFGGPTVVLKAPRSRRDHNDVCRPQAFTHHGSVNMNAILGIWRRYLVEEAAVMGAVYINADDTAVQRNAEWFKVYPLLDRESLWNYLDRLYYHSKQEVQAKTGSVVGKQINLALVSQVVVGATKPSKSSLKDFKAQLRNDAALRVDPGDGELLEIERELMEFGNADNIPRPGTVHTHYHIAPTSWTMSLCEVSDCERRSFSYEEARQHLNYSGEKWWGIGSDFWLERNTYAAAITDGGEFKGGNMGRGKWRQENLGDLKLQLLTGRIGKHRYDYLLNSMLHKNKSVGPREFSMGEDFMEQFGTRLRKQYRKKDCLAPLPEDERSGLLGVSSLHADWDKNLDTIVSDSAELLTVMGHTLNDYQDVRNNREDKRKKTH